MVCSAVLAGSAASAAAQAAPAKTAAPPNAAGKPTAKEAVTPVVLPPSPKALLPEALDGWVAAEPPKSLPDPAQADPANAAALKEYDYAGGASVTYKREGETLSVRALRFRMPPALTVPTPSTARTVGQRKTSAPALPLTTTACSSGRATPSLTRHFSHIGPMSASEMRELASHVPSPPGTRATMPPILANLPQGSLDGQTTHYAIGPIGYAGGGGVLPPDLVGFDRGAEAVTANYTLNSGPATLTIIDYPTPQMAEAQEPKIRAYLQAGSKAQPPWSKPLQDSDIASLEVRRSGPLVAIVSGDAIPDESHKLLEMVHFEADLTSIPQPTESEVEKDSQDPDEHRRHRHRGGQRRASARILPRRRQGTVPHCARKACLVRLRRRVYSHRFARRMGR